MPLFPPAVKKVMETIAAYGHEVYVVGGAVRDILAGVEPREYDVCTNASPEKVLKMAAEQSIKTYKKGAAFGVVAWVIGGEEVEIATFRREYYGDDAHRPESVEFVGSLHEDLARRDFTVNAIAMGPDGSIIDPFEGALDLKVKLLRAVGEPEERFAEDALRMFRACRFIAEYGFEVADDILAAIPQALPRVRGLSVERVKSELNKTLLAEYAVEGLSVLRATGLLASTCRSRVQGRLLPVPILPEVAQISNSCWEATLRVIAALPPDSVLRWSALLHNVSAQTISTQAKNGSSYPQDYGRVVYSSEVARKILERLRFPPSIVRRISWLILHQGGQPVPERKAVLAWLRKLALDFGSRGELLDAVRQTLILRRAVLVSSHNDAVSVLRENEEIRKLSVDIIAKNPFYPEDLSVSGGDLAALVGSGPQVKLITKNLISQVQEGVMQNQPEQLLEVVREYFGAGLS